MEAISALATLASLAAVLKGCADGRKASAVKEQILKTVEKLPEQVGQLGAQLAELRELATHGGCDHAKICHLLEDMATRLDSAPRNANLQIACAEHFNGRNVTPRFFRMMDDPHKRKTHTMKPVGTLFSIHLDLTNTGERPTTVKRLWASVKELGTTCILDQRRSGGQIYCEKGNYFAAEDALKQGQRVTLQSGAVETVHLCLVTPKNVPMGMNTVSGTVRCEDILGNAVHVECTFVQEG